MRKPGSTESTSCDGLVSFFCRERIIGCAGAFALVEMLVVLAAIIVLLGLLVPVLLSSRHKGDVARCLGNLRQVAIGLELYAADNEDALIINIDGFRGGFTNWVAGNMAFPVDAVDKDLLVDRGRSLLASYLASPGAYKCPADESPNVRSVAMNCGINPTRLDDQGARWVENRDEAWKVFRSTRDFFDPSRVFVIVDESEHSINDAYFAVDMTNTGHPYGQGVSDRFHLVDIPANHHLGAAGFSFADGHVEMRPWVDVLSGSSSKAKVRANSADVAWLQAHSTEIGP